MVIWSTWAVAHAFLTKTHTTVLRLMAGGETGGARGPPPLLPDLPYFRVQWPQLMWVHSCNSPPPSHICALCRNHMCPQSLKPEVKDDLEEAFRKLREQKWRMLSTGLDSHGQDSYSTRALQEWGLLSHCPCQPRAQAGDWRPSQKNEEHASNAGPRTHPCIQ